MSEVWYRYQENHAEWRTEVRLYEYRVVKHTPKGVWLSLWGGSYKDRFVLRDARKRFACPTKEEAMASFIARKKRQIKILRAQLDRAERALEVATNGTPRSNLFTLTESFCYG